MCIVLNKKEGASCITTHLLFYILLPSLYIIHIGYYNNHKGGQ